MPGIYIDHAATTPLHPAVLEAMLPFFGEYYGNASSIHNFGRTARTAIDNARGRMASLLGCSPNELFFTSGGTESDNWAIFGLAAPLQGTRKHIITTQVEHHAVLHACERLEKLGFDVTYLPVDQSGRVAVQEVEAAVRPDTCLISVMYANNEVGTLQPIKRIGTLARERGIYFHVDAVQALGAVAFCLHDLPVDLMSFSAHKINGPKGIGALYVARGVAVSPLIYGGAQERRQRAGTENVPGIIGFAKAVDIVLGRLAEKQRWMVQLRRLCLDTLTAQLGADGYTVNGHADEGLANILNISFPGISTETMLMNLDLEGIAASSGSACTAGSLETSHVLQAMRLSEEIMKSAIRFSFGFDNTRKEIITAASKTATIANRLRNK